MCRSPAASDCIILSWRVSMAKISKPLCQRYYTVWPMGSNTKPRIAKGNLVASYLQLGVAINCVKTTCPKGSEWNRWERRPLMNWNACLALRVSSLDSQCCIHCSLVISNFQMMESSCRGAQPQIQTVFCGGLRGSYIGVKFPTSLEYECCHAWGKSWMAQFCQLSMSSSTKVTCWYSMMPSCSRRCWIGVL